MRRALRILAAGLTAASVLVVPQLTSRSVAAPAKPASLFDARTAFDPSAQVPLHTPSTPPAADANGGTLQLKADSSVEAAQGPSIALALPGQGGDAVQLHTLGVVSRTSATGATVWQRSTTSLYADWHVTFQNGGGFVYAPQIVASANTVDPLYISNSPQFGVASTHPVAVGDLAGDRSPDVAVAETVGVNLGAIYCLACDWPFDVPGSNLHLGSFVTVLDGRTGRTLYSELDPGIVTQLAITNGALVVGDETGDPTPRDQDGQWGSATGVHALTFRHSGSGLAARTAWRWSTAAPWARLLDLVPTGGGIALSWSDTPLGLGSPRPPDGHVVLLDQRGRARWDARTPGYPVLLRYDAQRALVVAADETDSTEAIGYSLLGLRTSSGRTAVQVAITGSEPTSLAVANSRRGSTWLVGAAATSLDLVQPPNWIYTAGSVTAVDPGRQQVVWSRTVGAQPDDSPPYPASIVPTGDRVLVGGYPLATGPLPPTPSQPLESQNELMALSPADGSTDWDDIGDVVDPATLTAVGAAAAGVTDDGTELAYDASTGALVARHALLQDVLAAVRYDVNGDATPDLVVGTQSGGVFALDGRDPDRQLWRADLAGPVHQLVLDGTSVVAAATTQAAVVSLRSGRVTTSRRYAGQYVWSLAVGRLGTHNAVVVATDHLDAFDAGTGADLWTYRPSAAAYFSDPVISDGYVVAEYQNQLAPGTSPSTMAAVGIDGATGRTAWSSSYDSSTTRQAVLWNGVFASPDIPGAGPAGVALDWIDSDYNGRVEVRDARTGAIEYTDVDSAAADLQGWAVDPTLGLVLVGQSSVVAIGPSGAVEVDGLSGTSAAFVYAGATPVLLTAQSDVDAYPGSVLTSGQVGDSLATYAALFSGRLSAADVHHVLATQYDERAWDVVGLNESANRRPFPQRPTGYERGVAVLSLTGQPASTTAASRAKPNAAVNRPDVLTVGTRTPSLATIAPQLALAVHGYSSSGQPQLASAAPPPYDPALMRSYLGLTGDGSGQTVAVVDAYADPNITADVGQFSTEFGLPGVCGSQPDCFDFTVSTPAGTATNANWALEQALDVEWIHALAPEASIHLVEAKDASFAALYAAIDRAHALHPDAISLSWGWDGEFSDETYYDRHCALTDSVCVVSTGDTGHPGEYPAYNPSTIAVGGTTLDLDTDGSVTSEAAWADSGGGQSYFEPRSAAQRAVVPGATRGIPDVSFDADPSTGVAVYDSLPYSGQTGWFQVGGTSVGAPAWSAILTDVDQLRAAAGRPPLTAAHDAAAEALYRSDALADITSGPANGICPTQCAPATGYDFVTGIGSPRSGMDVVLAR